MNKTQMVRELLAREDSGSLRRLLSNPSELSALTLPAKAEIADGLILSKRWADVAFAFEIGAGSVFSDWAPTAPRDFARKNLSQHLELSEADALFKSKATRPLISAVASDLAKRLRSGEWGVWESHKDSGVFTEALFGDARRHGFLFEELLVAQSKNAGPMPMDLKSKAATLSAVSGYWETHGEGPELTQWGGINRKEAMPPRIHGLFMKGQWKAAVEAARLFGVEEYGSSGRGPIDSAFMSGSIDAVEALIKFDPFLILRPVKSEARRWRSDSSHIPLNGFLNDCQHSTAFIKYGLAIDDAAPGKDFISLPALIEKWVGGAYAAAGSKGQKEQWQSEWDEFKAAANTGRLPMSLAINAMRDFVEDAVERLGIPTKITASYRDWMKSPDYLAELASESSWRDIDIANKIRDRAIIKDHIVRLSKSSPKTPPPPRSFNDLDMRQRGELTPEEIQDISKQMQIGLRQFEQTKIAESAYSPDFAALSSKPESAEISSPAMGREEPPRIPQALEIAGHQISNETLTFTEKLQARRASASSYVRAQTQALGRAISRGDHADARKALDLRADPNGTIGSNDKMLHRAAGLSDATRAHKIIDLLLAAGADPKLKDNAGRAPDEHSHLPEISLKLKNAIALEASPGIEDGSSMQKPRV